MAWSSWSPPTVDPTVSSTPITVNGWAPIVTVWPTGSRTPNSSSAVVEPSTTSGCTLVELGLR